MTLTDERKVALLRKLDEEDPDRQWSRTELTNALLRMAGSISAKDRNGLISYHKNRKAPSALLRKTAPVAPSPRYDRAQPATPPPQKVRPDAQAKPKDNSLSLEDDGTTPGRLWIMPSERVQRPFEDHPLDQAWLGLALIVGELRRRWSQGSLEELGQWVPRKRLLQGHERLGAPHGRPAEGGNGTFLLESGEVKKLLVSRGLHPGQVLADLADRGILDADPGHNSKVVWVDGKSKRALVLSDRYVLSRRLTRLGTRVRGLQDTNQRDGR